MNPVSITMFPPEVRERYRWLFDHLERAYPVVFTPCTRNAAGAHGPAILFGDGGEPDGPSPVRSLVFLPAAPGSSASQSIEFTDVGILDSRLRGRVLEERSLPPLPPITDITGTALALCNGGPVWLRRRTAGGTRDFVRLPAEVQIRERLLWDNLQEYRFFFLITLVHFLYEVLAESGWTPPPLRAAFVVDDPNLRSRTYGFFRFPMVAACAREEQFHVSLATAPIDLAGTSPRMARFVADHADVLSLSIHGNNHVRHELLHPTTEQAALPLLCRMMRRVEEFERRHRVPVSRVVVPPNEMCSAATLRALRRFPVAAVCASRPWPWLPGDTWADRAGSDDGLLCWLPGESVEGGMTVIRRSMLPNNMVFRAFLNQPVIRYFHHDKFKGEMDLPRRTAEEINSLGGVHWMSLGDIAATNYESRVQGTTMIVRPFSRHVRIAVPEPVTTLRLDVPAGGGDECRVVVEGRRTCDGAIAGGTMIVVPGSLLDLRLTHMERAEGNACRPARTTVAAWTHRRISETVDRLRLPR